MTLTWIVPARRAVVSVDQISYRDALSQWAQEIQNRHEALGRWYFAEDGAARLHDARAQLVSWIASFDAPMPPVSEHADASALPGVPLLPPAPTVVSAAPESTSTLHRIDPMLARLWKGPLRVLLEAPGPSEGPAAGAPSPAPDPTRRRGAPHIDLGPLMRALVLTDHKEIANSDATLFPGDVVEFPLFKLLALAGKEAFGSMQFDPNGSFLLGTALTGEGDGARLHDNRLAMRFQALLSAARGAFSARGDTWASTVRNTPSLSYGGVKISARGILYGGVFKVPVAAVPTPADPAPAHGHHSAHPPSIPTGPQGQWTFRNLGWAQVERTGDPLAQNLPTKSGLEKLRQDPLTPGWSCSPCMQFFTYFILDLLDVATPRGGGVGTEIANHADSVLRRHADVTAFTYRLYKLEDHDQLREHMGMPPEPSVPSSPPAPGQPRPESAEQRIRAFALERLGVPVDPAATNDRHLPPAAPTWTVPIDRLSPISVLSLASHERSLVLIKGYELLVDEGGSGAPPVVGFLAAYDPLTGGAYVPRAPAGQLFDFQAADSLTRNNPYSAFGCAPTTFAGISAVTLAQDPAGGFKISTGTGSAHLGAVTRIHADALSARHEGTPDYKPIVFMPASRRSACTVDPATLHAERAVPYPTLQEAVGAFPSLAEAEAMRSQVALALADTASPAFLDALNSVARPRS